MPNTHSEVLELKRAQQKVAAMLELWDRVSEAWNDCTEAEQNNIVTIIENYAEANREAE